MNIARLANVSVCVKGLLQIALNGVSRISAGYTFFAAQLCAINSVLSDTT